MRVSGSPVLPRPLVRSWLFAPGHSEKLLVKVFEAGADLVVLDLEDAVPAELKPDARANVAAVIRDHSAWVRINRAGSAAAEADLDAVAEHAEGLRIPKVESADDVAWVAARAPGRDLACTIELARGVLAAAEIATAPGCRYLVLGIADLTVDLSLGEGWEPLLLARSTLVLASRAAGIEPPIDGAYTRPGIDGLRAEAEHARRLGFRSKSAVRPVQIPVINAVFQLTDVELEWARRVVAAFDHSGGAATRLPDGEVVDLPIATKARNILSWRADA